MAELLMKQNPWKREFLRPDGAHQVATGYVDGGRSVDVYLPLPTQHHIMSNGWQERARLAAERKYNAGEYARGAFSDMVTLTLAEIGDQ